MRRLTFRSLAAIAFVGVVCSAGFLAAQQATSSETAGVLMPAMMGQAPAAEQPMAAAAAPAWQPSDFFKSLTWKGYVETSYIFNFQSPRPPSGNENRGRIFDTNSNEFMLNAVEFIVEKPVDKDNPVGFLVNPLIGQTAPVIQSVGLFSNDFDGDGTLESDGNFDLVQAYIQAYLPGAGTTIKVGKWVTTTGAEVIYAPQVDNVSRSYLFGFAIPFTHTGILATQPLLKRADGVADLLTFSAGVANGWDQVKDVNESKLFIASSNFIPCDAVALASNFYYSFSEQSSSDTNGRTLLDFVATIFPIPDSTDLKFISNFDWGGEEGADADGSGYAQWWGFAGGLRYDFPLCGDTKNWFIAGRGEYFDDVDGSRTSTGPSSIGGAAGSTSLALWELTFTLGYQPWKSLLLRSELRYDKADDKVFFSGRGGTGGSPDESHQTTLGFDAMFIF